MCSASGCSNPPAGIARLRRPARGDEPAYKGYVWGPWETLCTTHLDERAASGDYLVVRDANVPTGEEQRRD